MTEQPTIPASVDMEPQDMRGKVEAALVAGLTAKETIGKIALRVLTAMREPTEAMLDAADEAGVAWADAPGDPEDRGGLRGWMWRAMIDAARAETQV